MTDAEIHASLNERQEQLIRSKGWVKILKFEGQLATLVETMHDLNEYHAINPGMAVQHDTEEIARAMEGLRHILRRASAN